VTVDLQQAEFVFRAEGVSLDLLSLERVCAYLRTLAELLGSAGHVHLARLEVGSIVAAARVDPPAIVRVRERLADASRGTPGAALAARNRLDTMLADDNASGALKEAGRDHVVIPFPGIQARMAELPAFWQDGELRGELVRLEGADDTKHGTLVGSGGDHVFRCDAGLAKDLRHRMWEMIRVVGRGRWRRGGDGTWVLLAFDADRFEVLDPEPIADTIARLRARGGFGLGPEAIAELAKLREE
jgi:hypothetical protein